MSIGDLAVIKERHEPIRKQIDAALRHTLNYNSIDARCGMSDIALVDMLLPELMKHLRGETDVQIIERMSPEERAQIGISR